MWNNDQQPPPSFPGAPSFPSFPSSGGFAPPPGPPPGGYSPSYPPSYPQSNYPPPPGPPPSGYAPPSGPPPAGYGPPPGPPPRNYGFPPGGYAPPPGPPPSGERGYPGAAYHQSHPPPGPPPGPGRYPSQQSHGGYQPSYQAPPPPRPPPNGVQNYGPQLQTADQRGIQPHFQYSQCNGKKKALLIGINYTGQNGELRGCINDVKNVKNFLITQWGYKADDMVVLTDDSTNPRMRPTGQNIQQAMLWLVAGARPHDALFFHYSGHGGQTKDLDGDEADGYDEVIYPVDFEENGHIVDDLMHDILVKPLPEGCRLTAIFDSCHSGSVLDLPYVYSTEGKIKEPNLAAEAGQGLLSAVTSYARGDMGGVFKSAMGLVKTATGNTQKADKITKATRTSPADVISFSGCKDSQTSADTQEAGQATGAMSFAFISALTSNPQQSYQQLLVSVREILRAKYSQKPQLSSSHPMDTTILFLC